jgi:type IV pilus assembly protein PilC
MAQAAALAKKEFPWTWEGTDRKGNRLKGRSLAQRERRARRAAPPGRDPGQGPQGEPALQAGGKITPMDIAVFSRQLATMLTAGIPLVQAFEIVGVGHDKPAMQKLILDIKADIEAAARCTRR